MDNCGPVHPDQCAVGLGIPGWLRGVEQWLDGGPILCRRSLCVCGDRRPPLCWQDQASPPLLELCFPPVRPRFVVHSLGLVAVHRRTADWPGRCSSTLGIRAWGPAVLRRGGGRRTSDKENRQARGSLDHPRLPAAGPDFQDMRYSQDLRPPTLTYWHDSTILTAETQLQEYRYFFVFNTYRSYLASRGLERS
jgi:hypothetical protein